MMEFLTHELSHLLQQQKCCKMLSVFMDGGFNDLKLLIYWEKWSFLAEAILHTEVYSSITEK